MYKNYENILVTHVSRDAKNTFREMCKDYRKSMGNTMAELCEIMSCFDSIEDIKTALNAKIR